MTGEYGEGTFIRSKNNKRLKESRLLLTRKGRRRSGYGLIFGSKILRDALLDGFSFDSFYLRAGSTLPIEFRGRVPCFTIARALYDDLVPFDHSPDMFAKIEIPKRDFAALDVEEEVAAWVVACGVQDPGNLGTIMRTAWFLGLKGMAYTKGTADPWSPKVMRASIGSLLRSPPVALGNAMDALHGVKKRGFRPVLLVAHGGVPLQQAILPKRAAFFLGEEGRGFERDVMESFGADDCLGVTIEGGGAESLNVAVAFSIVAYTWSRQHGVSSQTTQQS